MSKDSVFATGILNHGFGLSPKLLMKDPSVSIEAKAIYVYISSYAGAEKSCFPSVKTICHELGISRQRYVNHRKILEQKGYIAAGLSLDSKSWSSFKRSIAVATCSIDDACEALS